MEYDYTSEDFDWVSENGKNSPVAFPYSFDSYFLWRDFQKHSEDSKISIIHTDRMKEWDTNAYKMSLKKVKDVFAPSRKEAATFIKSFYKNSNCKKDVECVGFSLGVNSSNGHLIGEYHVREKT